MKIHQLFKTILVLTLIIQTSSPAQVALTLLQFNTDEDIKETENDLLTSMVDENMALNNSSAIKLIMMIVFIRMHHLN